MITIIPTILVKNFQEFKNCVKKIENDFALAQIDIMDGKFVANKTFFDIEKICSIKTPLNYELHLMVENPLDYIYKVKGNKKIKKIFFHYEADDNFEEILRTIQSYGFEAGIVINPKTKLNGIKKYIPMISVIMVMGVYPGMGGQKFLATTLEKIKKVRKVSEAISIEVDGGVNDKTAKKIVQAGADILAVGSFIYDGEPKKQKEKLLRAIRE